VSTPTNIASPICLATASPAYVIPENPTTHESQMFVPQSSNLLLINSGYSLVTPLPFNTAVSNSGVIHAVSPSNITPLNSPNRKSLPSPSAQYSNFSPYALPNISPSLSVSTIILPPSNQSSSLMQRSPSQNTIDGGITFFQTPYGSLSPPTTQIYSVQMTPPDLLLTTPSSSHTHSRLSMSSKTKPAPSLSGITPSIFSSVNNGSILLSDSNIALNGEQYLNSKSNEYMSLTNRGVTMLKTALTPSNEGQNEIRKNNRERKTDEDNSNHYENGYFGNNEINNGRGGVKDGISHLILSLLFLFSMLFIIIIILSFLR
jgi:hypothetical protein